MREPAEPYPVREVKEVRALITEALHGKGTEDDPVRLVRQLWWDEERDGEIVQSTVRLSEDKP